MLYNGLATEMGTAAMAKGEVGPTFCMSAGSLRAGHATFAGKNDSMTVGLPENGKRDR